MRRLAAGLCVALVGLAGLVACTDRSTACDGKCGAPTTTSSVTVAHGGTGTLRRGTAMQDAIPALKPWCRRLEHVYRTEAVPPKPQLVEHAVQLVDQLQVIVHTGSGVASMKDGARASPERAALMLTGLRGGSLCRRNVAGTGSVGRLVLVSPS